MEDMNQEILKQLNQIRIDVNFIKQAVDEGELTEWAENELDEARRTPDGEFISMEEIEKEFS